MSACSSSSFFKVLIFAAVAEMLIQGSYYGKNYITFLSQYLYECIVGHR